MKKVPIIFVWIAAILSTIYLLIIGWYNVLSLDDYGYTAGVEENGVFGLVRDAYMGWQCRFSTFFVNGLIMLIFGRASNLVGVTILMLCTGWIAVERLLTGISNTYKLNLSCPAKWGTAILCANIGVMSFLQPSTFYWLCALNYTIAIWATIFLLYFIFFSSSPLWTRWIGAIISSIYISGSAENYTPLVILILGIVLLYMLQKQNTWKWYVDDTTHLLFISLMVLSIGFCLMLFGPGNKMRIEMDGGDSILMGNLSMLTYAKRIVKGFAIFTYKFLTRGLYYVALFPVFMWIGAQAERRGFNGISAKQIGYMVILWLSLVLLNVVLFIFGAGYIESRALCFMSFVLVAITGYLGIRTGMSLRKKSFEDVAVIVSTSALILFLIVIIKTDTPIVRNYHQYVTARNEQINEKAQYYKTHEIPIEKQTAYRCAPFVNEPKVPLMVSELSDDPNDWRNQGLQQYYHADFDIICAEQR